MSWFEKIMPSRIKTERRTRSVPEGLWIKCPACDSVLYRAELERNLSVCPKCSHHMRIGARERLRRFLDPGTGTEIGAGVLPEDPLKFKDSKRYKDRLSAAQKGTGERDALIVLAGRLEGLDIVAAAFEFKFLGGSMGSVVGERFKRAVDHAIEHRAPLVCFSASGGARMQEALLSLLQMAKTSAALARLAQAHVPFISVLTDPTTGGVSASLAMLGDLNVAEPRALIGFAGPRVIQQTVRETLPEGFQRSEFLLEHGAIDMIVDRRDMRERLSQALRMLMRLPPAEAVPADADDSTDAAAAQPVTDAALESPGSQPASSATSDPELNRGPSPPDMAPLPTTLDGWLDHQQRQSPRSIDLGLERVRAVAGRAGLAAPPYPSILVGGTNGKGSTVALLAALARSLGLRAGTFTSPHLLHYNERIAIDGAPVADAALVAAFARIEAARGAVPLTFFEYNTLAAWDIFARSNLDLAIVEVGLGGRLDATNAVDPDVAVLCSVGLDHRDWLGATREQIGAEKAGIFRAGRPAILGSSDMPQSVHHALSRVGAVARWAGTDFSAVLDAGPEARDGAGVVDQCRLVVAPARSSRAGIAGRHPVWQRIDGDRWVHGPRRGARARPWLARLDAVAVSTALRSVVLPGRFQVVPGSPEWILDVAHNEAAAQVLAAELAARPCAGRTLAVAGMLADKDIEAIGAALATAIDAWVLCSLEGPRATDAEELRRRLPAGCRSLALAADVADGCRIALAAARPADRIVVLGSFHTVGPALDWLRIY